MKLRRVVHGKNLPIRCPLVSTLVLWMVLDKVSAAGWVWGVVGTLVVVMWVEWLIDIFAIEHVEIL